MHTFDPNRRQTANNRPALLLEGSALPIMHVVPRDDNKDGIVWVDLVCYLRNFEEGSERAYSTKLKTIPIDGLLLFFSRYINDPEAALLEYFGWEDRAPPESSRTSRQRAPTIQFTTDPMEDLL